MNTTQDSRLSNIIEKPLVGFSIIDTLNNINDTAFNIYRTTISLSVDIRHFFPLKNEINILRLNINDIMIGTWN